MKVFADTLYWIAITNPRDPWHQEAKRARALTADPQLVTTEEVLSEFLTGLSAGGPFLRTKAALTVRSILSNPAVTVMAQSHESFLEGLDLYERRRDKEYSLTDCISMSVMRSQGIEEALTHDHHFAQEGFTALIRRDD